MSNLNLNNLTFKTAWLELLKTEKLPKRLRNLIVIDYKELKEKVLKEESKFVEEFTNSVFSGDCYIMSEKSSGFDWKKRSLVTLRHGAGVEGSKYLK